jgi:hypothetical protein
MESKPIIPQEAIEAGMQGIMKFSMSKGIGGLVAYSNRDEIAKAVLEAAWPILVKEIAPLHTEIIRQRNQAIEALEESAMETIRAFSDRIQELRTERDGLHEKVKVAESRPPGRDSLCPYGAKELLEKTEDVLLDMLNDEWEASGYKRSGDVATTIATAVLRVAIEACAVKCELARDHAKEHYGVAESVGAEMALRKIRALLDNAPQDAVTQSQSPSSSREAG